MAPRAAAQASIKIISAGAGSGKTFRLTQELVQALREGARAEGIIATTFTTKAAGELQARVQHALLAEGHTQAARDLAHALIGTVHSLGLRLLRRFAYEAGVSPQVDIIAEEDHQALFNQALAHILLPQKVEKLEAWADRLGLNDGHGQHFDWRRTLRQITETARANRFDAERLRLSCARSVASLLELLPDPMTPEQAAEWEKRWAQTLSQTIAALRRGPDTTKVTRSYLDRLDRAARKLERGEKLAWKEYLALATERVGKKSREAVAPFQTLALQHERHPDLRKELQQFTSLLFELAQQAIAQYAQYKQSRGLIDYTDMEVLVDRLLDKPEVQHALASQLDLLIVDEFQDTSPIQLSIFLKLSKLAKKSVWVGDPKQSIYGFRGADPALMESVVRMLGGVHPTHVLEHSWRSREELVYLTNALFTEAFGPERLGPHGLPPEQVALKPQRRRGGHAQHGFPAEPEGMQRALWHWHLTPKEGRVTKTWLAAAVARTLRERLEAGICILPKGASHFRKARPGDVAVLCRTNKRCLEVAEALHAAGLQTAMARTGLLDTAEARLITACLKLLIHPQDARATAEVLVLAGICPLDKLIADRLEWMAQGKTEPWAKRYELISQLDELHPRVAELGSAEVLARLLDQLDLRRLVARWGKADQRLANVEKLMAMAVEYEARCARLHAAASLGGFLLWLDGKQQRHEDWQGAAASPQAVNVLTYHASKGLEWPIVICMDLDQPLRAEPWGLSIESDRREPDPHDILGGRWLRFWIQPYGKMWKRAPMGRRLQQRAEYVEARQRAQMEEARLLYVGITRARDHLVWPTTPHQATTAWLNRVALGPDMERAELLLPDTDHTPWAWNEHPIAKETLVRELPLEMGTLKPPPAPRPAWLAPPAGRRSWPPAQHDPQHKPATLQAIQEITYAPAFAKREIAEAAAKATAAFFRADTPNQPPARRRARARKLLQQLEADTLSADQLLARADALWQTTGWQSDPHWTRLWPLRCALPPHDDDAPPHPLFETTIDLLAERPQSLCAVQHCEAALVETPALLRHYAGWCALTLEALQTLFPDREIQLWLHSPLAGRVWRVQVPHTAPKPEMRQSPTGPEAD